MTSSTSIGLIAQQSDNFWLFNVTEHFLKTLINNTKIFNNKEHLQLNSNCKKSKTKSEKTCFRFDKTACFCFLLAITYLLPLCV